MNSEALFLSAVIFIAAIWASLVLGWVETFILWAAAIAVLAIAAFGGDQ